MTQQHPYGALTPDTVINAVESLGLYSDFRQYPLNSYENRVYQVGIEDRTPLIVKFYRPGRWTPAQIQEEHDVLAMLDQQGIAVAAPMTFDGKTLFEYNNFHFSVTQKLTGMPLEAGDLDQLYAIGELVGHLHHQTQTWTTPKRPLIEPKVRTLTASKLVENCPFLPKTLVARYRQLAQQLIEKMTITEQRCPTNRPRFIHGDCHRSNLLNCEGTLTLLDFDDCRMGLAIQDLWLHVSEADTKQQQLSELIEGYENYHPFDTRELDLIDVFMAERHIAYTAWIAERWQDPAFPAIFPHFKGEDFWLQHLNDLDDILKQWGQWR